MANLYQIMYDSQAYWVEATDFTKAIKLWKSHVKIEWGKDYDGTEEPESVSLIHDESVIGGSI